MANESAKTSAPSSILTVNGGSSSIKIALFQSGGERRRMMSGKITGIGLAQGKFEMKGASTEESFTRKVALPGYADAVGVLLEWAREQFAGGMLAAIGHRVVHGGPKYWEPQRVTTEMIAELHGLSTLDPEHLPEEIQLIEAFQKQCPGLPQVACFDTAFHHDMPRLARMLPIPRRYEAKGIRRYGFHGLSCEYLMESLAREAGPGTAQGRVILAHLGNGASITAARGGRSVDTSMSFTPTAGLPMSTRSGDLDPSLAWHLAQTEHLTPEQFHHLVNHESGLLGISETTSDMSELFERAKEDSRAAEAIAMFCYQARKWICAMAGALEGLDTLVFAGGIGENVPEIRERICGGLGFLGISLDSTKNNSNAALISSSEGPATVRVIRTDEEWIIARSAGRVLGWAA
ncbi:MAG TPA: acetate/propionate family kinase [Verrucomicrobiae bacterium]|jgi:acetate kinase